MNIQKKIEQFLDGKSDGDAKELLREVLDILCLKGIFYGQVWGCKDGRRINKKIRIVSVDLFTPHIIGEDVSTGRRTRIRPRMLGKDSRGYTLLEDPRDIYGPQNNTPTQEKSC